MLSAIILGALWLIVLWRIPGLRQDRWKRAPWLALAGLAVALTADLPASISAIDRATGIADLSTLVKHLAGIAASAAVLDWVPALKDPSRKPGFRRHHVAAMVAATAMTALFAVMPRPESDNFTATVAGGTAAAYLLVFYVYLGTAMTAAATLFWQVSRAPPEHEARGAFRWGLWLLASGTTTGACYSAYQVIYLALRCTGIIDSAGAGKALAAGAVMENLAIVLILAGMSVPAFSVAWEGARDLASWHALRDMRAMLISAVPEVSADPRDHGLAGPVSYPRLRLTLRVTEIRDATLALRCRVAADVVTDARNRLAGRGLTGTALDAAAEACWLRLAIRAPGPAYRAEDPRTWCPAAITCGKRSAGYAPSSRRPGPTTSQRSPWNSRK